MKTYFLSFILIIITTCFISCKKDSTTQSGGGNTTNSAATPLSYSLSTTGDPSGMYSGVLYEVNASAIAAFYTSPTLVKNSTSYIGSNSTASVSSVFCNNIKLKYNSFEKEYYDTTYALTSPPFVWTVNGASSLPSFTYSYTIPIPSYNLIGLPNIINRGQNLIIPLNNAANFDQIQISIDDGISLPLNIFRSRNDTSVIILKDSLARLLPDTNGSISILLYKYNPQSISGKNFLFVNRVAYVKGVILQ